jgi:hypothetical protein
MLFVDLGFALYSVNHLVSEKESLRKIGPDEDAGYKYRYAEHNLKHFFCHNLPSDHDHDERADLGRPKFFSLVDDGVKAFPDSFTDFFADANPFAYLLRR